MAEERWENELKIVEYRKWRQVNAPRRLPRARPRSLTCPPPGKGSQNPDQPEEPAQQQTFDQSRSMLLARLPPEIRRMIWTMVLGGHLLHIVRAPQRLVALRCTEDFGPDLATFEHKCWNHRPLPWPRRPGHYVGPRPGDAARPANLLPLLQTCRMIYTEAISIPYQDNIFDIDHQDTILYLRYSVLPQRLNQIRVLNFTWLFKHGLRCAPHPYDRGTWHKVCAVLARLTGLQKLMLHLWGGDTQKFPHSRELWELLLEPLTHIRAQKTFCVFMPWDGDYCKRVMEEFDCPFRILRNDEIRGA